MTLTSYSTSSCGDALCNSRRSNINEEHLLVESLATTMPAKLSCTMEISKLLVALTAPLLGSSTSCSADSSSSSGSGDGSGEPSNSQGEKSSTREETSAEPSDGKRKTREQQHQKKEQQHHHKTGIQLLERLTSCVDEPEPLTTGEGEDGATISSTSTGSDKAGPRKGGRWCKGADPSQQDAAASPTFRCGSDVALGNDVGPRRHFKTTTFVATGDVAAAAGVSLQHEEQERNVVEVLRQRADTKTIQPLAEPVTEEYSKSEGCSTAEQKHIDLISRRRGSDVALRCVRPRTTAQQCPSPGSTEAATKGEEDAALGASSPANEIIKRGPYSGSAPGAVTEAQKQGENEGQDYHMWHRRGLQQQQQGTSPATAAPAAAGVITLDQAQQQSQQRERPFALQQQQKIRGEAPPQEKQEKMEQQEQQRSAEMGGTTGVDAEVTEQLPGEKDSGEKGRSYALLPVAPLEKAESAERVLDHGDKKMQVKGTAEKEQGACGDSSLLQGEEEQLLLTEGLLPLGEASFLSEESTSSPSKRTSFEDAEEGTAATVEQKRSGKTPLQVKLQQHENLKELKRQLLRHGGSEEKLKGLLDNELEKSVTAVLAAAALQDKCMGIKADTRGERSENGGGGDLCETAFSPVLDAVDGFTSSSSETAASSQSPSSQKEETAAEDAAKRHSGSSSVSVNADCGRNNSNTRNSSSLLSIGGPCRGGACARTSTPPVVRGRRTSCSNSVFDKSSAATDSNLSNKTSSPLEVDSAAAGRSTCSTSSCHDMHGCSGSGTSSSIIANTSGSTAPKSTEPGKNSCCGSNNAALGNSNTFDTSSNITSNITLGWSRSIDVSGRTKNSRGAFSENAAAVNSSESTCRSASICTDGGRNNAPQETRSSSSSKTISNWASTIIGEAILQDCIQSAIDLEQDAARVLVPSAAAAAFSSSHAGGANQQVSLPSLLLQKTTFECSEEQLTAACGLWGGYKMEKLEAANQNNARMSAAAVLAASAPATFGLYPSAAREERFQKDRAGALVQLPSFSPNTLEVTPAAPGAAACGAPRQHLDPIVFPGGNGFLLDSGAAALGSPSTPHGGGVTEETAEGKLEESLSQMWMMQQRNNCLSAPVSTAAASSAYSLPSHLHQPIPWTPPAANLPPPVSQFGPTPRVARTPAAGAVAAAALLPRSFRSRSDYLSLCSLQGCPATQENERKPRTLKELRQCSLEDYISLQEMHLLAENLAYDFMKLRHVSSESMTGTKAGICEGRQENLQENSVREGERASSVAGTCAAEKTEPLVLHYRRDNLSFSVAPASSFTLFPSSFFDGARKKHQCKGDSSALICGMSSCSTIVDEMEEEKKETLLGGRFFAPAKFQMNNNNSSCFPTSGERSAARSATTVSRGHSRSTVAAEGGRTLAANDNNADEFLPPRPTTHLYRARCQQAGTEAGISDSTVGAVHRAFAKATSSYFKEVQRRSKSHSFGDRSTRQSFCVEQGGNQQRTRADANGCTEEPPPNAGQAGIKAPPSANSRQCRVPNVSTTCSTQQWCR